MVRVDPEEKKRLLEKMAARDAQKTFTEGRKETEFLYDVGVNIHWGALPHRGPALTPRCGRRAAISLTIPRRYLGSSVMLYLARYLVDTT